MTTEKGNNMDDLFNIEETKGDSPRLAWMKERFIKTQHVPNAIIGDEDEFGNDVFPFLAWINGESYLDAMPYHRAGGITLDDALQNLAVKRGWKLWNYTK